MARPLNLTNYQAVIPAGGSLSGTVSVGADSIVGILFPPGWAAGSVTFQVTVDGVTFVEFLDNTGAAITIGSGSGAAPVYAGVDSALWRGVNMLRIRSGTLAAPVVQGAGATLVMVGRGEEW